MFEEAQLYAPVTRSGDDVTVHLGDDHPGAVDPEYRARRNALAALAMDWQPGTPHPSRHTPMPSRRSGASSAPNFTTCTCASPAPHTSRARSDSSFPRTGSHSSSM